MVSKTLVWIPTHETLEHLLRQTRLSTADNVAVDRNQLEGVLVLALRNSAPFDPTPYLAKGNTKCRHGTPIDIQCVDCALTDDADIDSTLQRDSKL